MTSTNINENVPSLGDLSDRADERAVVALLSTTTVPGVVVEVGPDDAALAGAFIEDAISFGDAQASMIDAEREDQ